MNICVLYNAVDSWYVITQVRDAGRSPYPTDGEKQAWPPTADPSKAVSEPPVEEVLGDKGDERQPHGSSQHVEDPGHVVHVQLAGHHFILLVMADSRQPLSLKLLHFT